VTPQRSVAAAFAAGLVLGACGGPPGGGDDGPDPRPDARDVDAGIDAPIDGPPGVVVGPEVDGKITINEFMAANALTLADEDGTRGDWIELYNPNDVAIALAGYGLTDDLLVPRKHVLGNVTIPARGRLVLWADNDAAAGAAHLGFALDDDQGDLAFTRPDGTFIDRVHYGEQEVDFSAAREPDGSDRWVIEWHPSPGTANPAGAGQPAPAEDPTQPPETIPDVGDLSEQVLGYDEEPQFTIKLGPNEVAQLTANPREYVRGTIRFRDRDYGPVGVRLKGGNSFQPLSAKPSFKIDMNEFSPGARFWGLSQLTLNNMDDDPAMMHERLSYWFARNIGVAASRSNHALVSVNETAYGLYANVETVKERMLKRWFTDPNGPLFEATDVDFAPPYINLFEHESGPDDRTLITGLSNALAIADPDASLAAAASFVDMERFIEFWAMESVVGQFDAFPYSFPGDDYFLYADPTSNRLRFIPWGMDETFFAGDFPVTQVSAPIATKCKASPTCYQRYADKAWDLLAVSEAMGMEAERARIVARIAPMVAADMRKPYTTEHVNTYQNSVRWFLNGRRAAFTSWLPPRSSTTP
jgi:hypothetical protein